jgi:MoaA/NifB/PqqE/SkfB family radical SAM enzyme
MTTTYLGNPGKVRPTKSYEIVNVNSQVDKNSNFAITFRITEACDLSCNYCDWHGGKHYAYDSIITSIDKLFEFFQKQKIKSVVFYYHGGEATRHNRVVDILKYIKSRSLETGIVAYNEMQTNLTVKTERLRDILEHTDLLNITFHYNELKRRPFKLKSFLKNFDYLLENNHEIHNLDVMLEHVDDANVKEFQDLVKQLVEYKNIVNSEMIYGFGYNNEEYNEKTKPQHYELYSLFNKTDQAYKIDDKLYTTNDMFNMGLDCTGWWCGAGQETIFVNGDGNVYNCGIHMTNNINNFPDTPFTNLITDNSALAKLSILIRTGTTCRWDYCGGDFYLNKQPPKPGQ